MDPESPRELTVSLRFKTVAFDPDGPVPVVCLGCRKPLEVHQPDAELPERMLATCEACKGWHLVECDPKGRTALVVLLPDGDLARRASGS